MEPKKSPWNSLEVVKVIVSILTPLVVGAFGYWIQSTIASQAEEFKSTQRIVDRRLAVYDEIRLGLNSIYSFVEDVGTWKLDTPESIAVHRRAIHAAMHTNRAIWSPQTFEAYLDYMDRVAFKTFSGVGQDAAIRTRKRQKEVGIASWKREWSERLTDEKDPRHQEKYDLLQVLLARDLRLSGIAG